MILYNDIKDLQIEPWMVYYDAVYIGDYSIDLKITKLENGRSKQDGVDASRQINESLLE